MKHAFPIFAASILAACSATPPTVITPIIVKATVEHPVWTGWVRDWCSGGKPAKEASCPAGEFSFGGEIYRVRLSGAVTINGQQLQRGVVIGYPAHALPKSFRKNTYMVLQPAPLDFIAATGIKFIATDYDSYDSKANCVIDHHVAHLDNRQCPDLDFHQTRSGSCVPVLEYLDHYAKHP